MYIKELTADEFRNFNLNYNLKSLYQTPEYGFVMNNQQFEVSFLGMIDENDNIIATTLILIEKKDNFKYAYAPRGFLIDYNNDFLVETFTNLLKKYLGKKNIIAIKLSPMIIKNIYDTKYNIISENNYFNKIFDNLKKLDYYHFGFNYYFEALKPRYEAVVDLDLPYYMLFNNITKKYKTKIRSAEKRGVKVYKGTEKNLEYLYLQTANKYPRDLNYFKDCYKYFKKGNNIEFFFTKLDTNKYLKYITKKYHQQENNCSKLIKMLNKNPLLYLTLGGVIAKGTPINAKARVVAGSANLSKRLILYSVRIDFSSLILLSLILFINLKKLYSEAVSLTISLTSPIPKLTFDSSKRLVLKILPFFEMV